ncbi:MAG: DUF6519 domain-containing protein [Phycisphaerales bacterium]
MSGDHSRFTFDPWKNYTDVLPQQGRVTIDADWVEQAEITDRRWRSESYDILNKCVVPMTTPDAFKITPTGLGAFTIGVGRMYVDGIQIENHGVAPLAYDAVLSELRGTNPVAYDAQPHYPGAPGVGVNAQTDLVYVDVWEREIAAVQDPHIRDVALGGVDTATRIQTVWQIKVLEDVGDVSCPDTIQKWTDETAPPTGRLTTSVIAPPASEDPCIISPTGGYRGLHNRLYRVELHEGGELSGGSGVAGATPRFKWSRHNASIMAEVESVVASLQAELTLSTLGRDDLLSIAVGDWIEIRDEHTALTGGPGQMAQVIGIPSPADRIIKIDRNIDPSFDVADRARRTHVVRWDQSSGVDANGLIDAAAGPITLEAGIQVEFSDGTYRAGDSWSFAARTSDGSIEELVDAPPRTTPHHYCRLALVTWTSSGGDAEDCREFWPPKSGCCVSVRPGEDVQGAIDRVVAAGGGCVQLCRGVHHLTKPLRLHNARNLHFHGVGPASILHIEADDGLGAIEVVGARMVRISDMTILGDRATTVVGVSGLAAHGMRPTIGLTLDALTVVALPTSRAPNLAGIRLRDCSEIHIEDCRIYGRNAILADAMTSQAEKPTIHLRASAFGVDPIADVKLVDVTLRFTDVGVGAFLADRWTLERCDIRSVNLADHGGGLPIPPGGSESAKYDALFELLDTRIFPSEGVTTAGACVRVGHWDRSRLHACVMVAQSGVDGMWLGRTRVTACDIRAGRDAVMFPELDRCSIDRCTLTAELGVGFATAYSDRIRFNRIRAPRGILGMSKSAGSQLRLRELQRWAQHLGAAGATNDVLAVFVHRALQAMGLTLADLPTYSTLLQLIAFQVLLRLEGKHGEKAGVPSLVVDLRIEGNDVECPTARSSSPACIVIEDFIPIGGLRVDANRLHAVSGQSVRINAASMAGHPAFTYLLINALLRAVTQAMTTAAGSITNTDFLNLLRVLMRWWTGTVAPFFEANASADNRVQDNSVVSRQAGIESNLFELTVRGNHVTMCETGLSRRKIDTAAGEMIADPKVAPLGYALRNGRKAYVAYTVTKYDADAGATLTTAAGATGDPDIISAAVDAEAAHAAGDKAVLEAKILDIASGLAKYANTCAIWMKGAGCRVIDNHAIVPADIDSDTRGRGGIRIWADPDEDAYAAILIAIMLGLGVDERLGITETLIARNEVVGGIGHGIEVRETPVFFDVKVQNNQVRAVGAAGICIDDASAVVGVEITDNQVADCGSITEAADAEDTSGGIVVRTAALCRIAGNQVTRAEAAEKERTAAGIECESIIHLTVDANRVIDCGGSAGDAHDGGIILLEVYGDVSISNNEALDNRGNAVFWVNSSDSPDTVISSTLQSLLALYRQGAGNAITSATMTASSNMEVIDFEDVGAGKRFGNNDTFSSAGYKFLVTLNSNGKVDTRSNTGSATGVYVMRAYIEAFLNYPVSMLVFDYEIFAVETLHLFINGDRHVLQGFVDSDGKTLSGVKISVSSDSTGRSGTVTLEGDITAFKIGAMTEGLLLDNIRFAKEKVEPVAVTTTGLIGDNRLAMPSSLARSILTVAGVGSINMTGNLLRYRSAGDKDDTRSWLCGVRNLVLSSNTFETDQASGDASIPLKAVGVTSGAIVGNVSPGAINVFHADPIRSIVYKGMNVPEAILS